MYNDEKLWSIEFVLLQKIKYLSTIDAQDICTVVAFLLLNLQDDQKNILQYHQQDKQIIKDNYLHIWLWLVIWLKATLVYKNMMYIYIVKVVKCWKGYE